ncbi:MAG: LysM peptidoglycan-binding domain-containing protein [Bacteroidales bacterium]|nr:LysM peptidoglycan-binding domain-containing protein [Bacteroidales bacterium]
MKRRIIFLLGVLIIIAAGKAGAQYNPEWFLMQADLVKTDTLDFQVKNSDTVNVDKLDSLVDKKIWGRKQLITDTSELNVYNFPEDKVPDYPDSVYKKRIKQLDTQTPINLTYNKVVGNYIDLYAMKKRNLTSRLLGLAYYYFPMFEEELDKRGLPLELKYLAIVESALHPRAGSHAGAKGIWQFMYRTGKVYDLNVNSFIDDRYDPRRATVAACEHLRDLYEIYGNWALAMAAYNSGTGNVNRAIRYAGGVKSYWAVWPFLPRETRGYVPAFIAVTYVMNHAAEHNLYPIDPGYRFHETDTVKVNDVLSFEQLSGKLGVDMETLEFLNPRYKKGIIPANDGKDYYLRLPYEYATKFLQHEQEVYAYKTEKGIEKEKLLREIEKAKSRRLHVVRRGENLGLIARKYRISVSRLKAWNNLRSSRIYPGQKLVVYTRGYESSTASSKSINKSGDGVHRVRKGETLGEIAKAYNVSVQQLRKWNNIRGNIIRVNQKIYIDNPRQKTASAEEGDTIYYKVKAGDTLIEIAKKFDGVTVEQLKKLNKIYNSRRLKAGQRIKINTGKS